LPKPKLVGLAESKNVGTKPVPLRAMVSGELVALLTTETLPVTLPAAAGAYTTLKLAPWPAARVNGSVKPLALKPAPDVLTCEIVTLELPMLLRITFCELLLPTLTVLKLKLVGLAESCSVVTTPVPLMVTVSGEFVASLTTVTLPVMLPPLVGAMTTVIWALWPAVRVCGTGNGPMLNPDPETPTCESLTLPLPVFVKVTV